MNKKPITLGAAVALACGLLVAAAPAHAANGICGALGAHWADNTGLSGTYVGTRARAYAQVTHNLSYPNLTYTWG